MSKIERIAVLLTVFNRKDKTLECLSSLFYDFDTSPLAIDVYLTDDGSTDGTREALKEYFPERPITILQGNGKLFWNGGMINSWKAAIGHGGYDGYLWLNNDSVILPGLAKELLDADEYSIKTYGKRGIYVGSLQDMNRSKFSYGGFNFTNKITLKDSFIIPNGEFQICQCAHGNITYVSQDVVEKMGIFYDGYFHGGTDHDYTYLAYKAGFPLIVLRQYVGLCENDHSGSDKGFEGKNLKQRIAYLKSPHGMNLSNTLLFQKRCFPWRYPFALIVGYSKAFFPRLAYTLYRFLRK